MELSASSPAPEFSLPDQSGTNHRLSDYRGKWVVLYFYPRDDTPGCTKEACGFRDIQADFTKINAVILGVSRDSVASHKKFAGRYHLNFTILSDSTGQVVSAYNAGNLIGTKRVTYLINPNGLISAVYPKVDPTTHSRQIITDIQNAN